MKRTNFLIIVLVTSLILFVTYILNDIKNIGFMVSYTSVFICVYIALHRMSKKVQGTDSSFGDYFSFPKMKKRYILYFSVLGFLLNTLLSMLYTHNFGLPNNEIRVQDKYSNQIAYEMEIYGGIQAPIIEEILHRGLLFLVVISVFQAISNKAKHVNGMNAIFLIISSTLFGLMHAISWGKLMKTMTLETDFKHTTPYLIAGIIFSLLYLMTRTLYAPIIAHMLNNITDLDISSVIICLGLLLFLLYAIFMYRSIKSLPITNWIYTENTKGN